MTTVQRKLFAFLFAIVSAGLTYTSTAQTIAILHEGNGISIRGLSAVDDNVVWVSGNKGTVGRSVDGGKTWTWNQVPGYAKREFRDIEAFDASTAIVLAIAEPGEILKTTDGGETWNIVYTDSVPGIFLDAFHFNSHGHGTVVGDPIEGRIYLASTADSGNHWTKITEAPIADSGEACFASSGTNIVTLEDGGYYLVTGGLSSRLHSSAITAVKLPLLQGQQSTGANSVAIHGSSAVIVGGDFAKDTVATGNCVLVNLGKTPRIKKPARGPHGYRSSVVFLDRNKLVTCGTSGVDVSADAGFNWKLISTQGFHVCQKARKGKSVYLAGSNGRIARLTF